jgi:Phage integrase, N-terminal SAM-like domain
MSPICPRVSVRFGAVSGDLRVPTGHVFRVERSRGPCWYAKYRLPDGRQVQKKLGPAWTERGRPPAGYLTKRLAEDWLRTTLDEARRGTLPGMVRTGATFADAAAEYLRYIGEDRVRKASTVEDYRSIIRVHLLPAFGDAALETITVRDVEAFQAKARQACPQRPADHTAHPQQGPQCPPRCVQVGHEGLDAPAQPRCSTRAPPVTRQRRHRGLRAGGGLGPGARRRRRARRLRLRDRRLHRPADGRVARTAVARC